MSKKYILLIFSIVFLIPVVSADMLLVSQNVNDTLTASSTQLVGQTFNTSSNQTAITMIQANSGLGATSILSVYNSPSKTSLLGQSAPTHFGFITNFSFSTPIPVTASTSYFFEITGSPSSTNMQVYFNSADGYADGQMYLNGVAQAGKDLWFSVYGTDKPKANWTFNEGSGLVAIDSSGYQNNGSVSATYTTNLNNGSVNASALQFNGTSAQVSVPFSTSLNLTSQFSISVWIKANNTATGGIIEKTIGGAVNKQYFLAMDTGKVKLRLVKNAATNDLLSDSTLPQNTWTHIAATYDGTTARMYINGNLQSTTLSLTGPIDGGNGVTLIGALGSSAAFFDGTIDEVQLYNYTFNQTEVTAVHNQFSPVPGYPVGGITVPATYPPISTTINFTWHDSVYPSDEIIVAEDTNFNIISSDTFSTTDYANIGLTAGKTYFWKVRQFNSTTSTYGNTSAIQTFTLATPSAGATTGIQGVVFEIINGVQTPINGATVYLYNSSTTFTATTGTNGYFLFTPLAAGSVYTMYASKQGYDTTNTFLVNTTAGTFVTNNLQMHLFISPYVPNFAFEKFVVRDLFDHPYPGVTVNVFVDGAVTPSFTGTTDSMGQVTFQLIKDTLYRVEFSGGGLSSKVTVNVYGKDEEYLLTIFSGFPTTPDRNANISYNFTNTAYNATFNNLSLVYNDTSGTTTIINYKVTNITNSSNQVVLCDNQTTGTSVSTIDCSVLNNASFVYLLSFNATSTTHGFMQANKVITFGSGSAGTSQAPTAGLATMPLSATWKHWLSIMFLVFLAALFSFKTVKFGAVLVPVVALMLWWMSWFQANIIIIGSALAFGILIYMRLSEVKLQY